jgi:hypothetical protein
MRRERERERERRDGDRTDGESGNEMSIFSVYPHVRARPRAWAAVTAST